MSEILSEKLSELKTLGVSETICERIGTYVREEPPPRLQHISPFRLADAWSMDHHEVLDAFLYGTKQGVFDLSWDVKCPSCKGPTLFARELAQLRSKSHCNNCEIDISGGFDDAVEVTFRVNANVRNEEAPGFLDVWGSWMELEGPRPIKAEAGKKALVEADLKPGSYLLFSPTLGVGSPLRVVEEHIEDSQIVEFSYDGKALSRDGTVFRTEGSFQIHLENKSGSDLELIFARTADFPWVSGAIVASNQIFRDLFSSELISSDESFGVKNVSFVFTDIKSSTDLYERRGDSTAYYLVREHFKIMADTVARNHGAIVKTIGDAIMATFLVSQDAVRAVFEMHKAFDEFNEREKSRDDIYIKVGVHRGPCLAVTSNDKLDYFGRTVNIAARVQGLSEGGDIVISKAQMDEPGIGQVTTGYGWKSEPFQAELKGIQGMYDVVRFKS